MTFQARRVQKTYTMSVAADPEAVFPLLCPAREYDWLPYWKCSMIYSESGRAERGAMFRTDFPEKGEATWIVMQYEPPKLISFAVFLPTSHAWTLSIALTRVEPSQTELRWSHTFTALTPAGNDFLSAYSDDRHQALLSRIERCLKHFLHTGQMLTE